VSELHAELMKVRITQRHIREAGVAIPIGAVSGLLFFSASSPHQRFGFGIERITLACIDSYVQITKVHQGPTGCKDL
jgi:hypothetical protein